MSEPFSFEPSSLSNPGSSSSLSQSKTPPPLLESSLSSSDQFSPTAFDSGASSPDFANPISFSIPNPFSPSMTGSSHEQQGQEDTVMGGTTGNTWRTEIHPVPIASSPGVSGVHHHHHNGTHEGFSKTSHEPLTQSSENVARSPRPTKQKAGVSKGNEEVRPTRDRRQKRLERNRESARLSRRRRKQYLEILETKVTELSDEMDKGRRKHISEALDTIKGYRANGASGSYLARTSSELRLAATFRSQQMQSLCTPPSTKFILWLTLQNDVYFRGGRAASERLSAARIGERMLQNGNDKAAPAHSMWPLFCNEVGLSYDQEERVRNFQKTLLAAKESWLERHTAYAARATIKSTHEAVQAVAVRLGYRERKAEGALSPEQRSKLGSFVSKHRAAIKNSLGRGPMNFDGYNYETNKEQHVSANLYIVNHRLSSVTHTIPPAAPLLTGLALKKLSRRPSFESLGVVAGDKKENDDYELSRDRSFASSGSLKRSASEISMDTEDRPQVQQISPEEAEANALPHVESVLGHLKPIIPVPCPAPPAIMHQMARTNPRAVTSAPHLSHPGHTMVETVPPPPITSAAPPGTAHQQTDPTVDAQIPGPEPLAPEEPLSKHQRKSSFFPPHLNVVPEEMWPAADSVAEEFLMSLVDEDWAIGEGVDMEI